MTEFGQQAYEAFLEGYPAQVNEPWAELDEAVRADWDRAARRAIGAYDSELQGKADEYAEQVASAPSFQDLEKQAIANTYEPWGAKSDPRLPVEQPLPEPEESKPAAAEEPHQPVRTDIYG